MRTLLRVIYVILIFMVMLEWFTEAGGRGPVFFRVMGYSLCVVVLAELSVQLTLFLATKTGGLCWIFSCKWEEEERIRVDCGCTVTLRCRRCGRRVTYHLQEEKEP